MARRPPLTPGNYRWKQPVEPPVRPELIKSTVRTAKGFTYTVCQSNVDRQLPILPSPEQGDD